MKTALLLHTCCGPCLTGSYDQLKSDYDVTIFWYNPNIEPKEEHDKRFETLAEYLKCINAKLILPDYDYNRENKRWHEFIHGLEEEPEGGKRCSKCFAFRLDETAKMANKLGLSFATTLSISPYKNNGVINMIGSTIGESTGTVFIPKNFGQGDGYRRSIEISRQYGLYRQKYCGCQYSLNFDRKKLHN